MRIAAFLPVVALASVSMLLPHAVRADDLAIPAKCRTKEAMDNDKCADVISARSIARNKRGTQRDAKANAALKDAILKSHVKTGETVEQALAAVAARVPFFNAAWNFVYARSGAEYAVLSFDARAPDHDGNVQPSTMVEDFFDYDLDPNPVMSLENSKALGMIAWKVDKTGFRPWGSYANALTLGPQAFAWYVNDGRKGFDDSGYNDAVAHDFSFLRLFPATTGNLYDVVSPDSAQNLTLFWNVVDGHVAQAANLPCPPQKIGDFTVRGESCEALAEAAKDISGQALPFKIIHAFRNTAYKNDMVGADVSVSVEGGTPGDWLATAALIAEHAIIANVTFATVSVFAPNPWGDSPPQHVKLLAKAYYAPNPTPIGWDKPWLLNAATIAPTPAEIEYDRLSNDLIPDPEKVVDPTDRLNQAETAARRIVIQKYRLPSDWAPRDTLGLDGQDHDREHVKVTELPEPNNSTAALAQCLKSNSASGLYKGCTPN